jgi:hypothetical protein
MEGKSGPVEFRPVSGGKRYKMLVVWPERNYRWKRADDVHPKLGQYLAEKDTKSRLIPDAPTIASDLAGKKSHLVT